MCCSVISCYSARQIESGQSARITVVPTLTYFISVIMSNEFAQFNGFLNHFPLKVKKFFVMNLKKPPLLRSVPRRQDCMKTELRNTIFRLTSEQLWGRRHLNITLQR
jgi:hypothetical protein